MKIGIVGCGSLGLLWGSRLSQMNLPLILLTRTPAQRDVLNIQGIHYQSLVSPNKQEANRVQADVLSEVTEPFDCLWVMVKQTHLAEIIPHVQRLTSPDSPIVFWQNGLGQEEHVKNLVDRPYTYAAVTLEGALKSGFNQICHTGCGATRIGVFPDDDCPLHISLVVLFEQIKAQIGLDIQLQPIQQKMWEKALLNSVINPLTARYRIKNGDLLHPKYQAEMDALLYEAMDIAHAEGYDFSYAEMMARIRAVCQATAENHSSMLQDIESGRLTEIHALNGYLATRGRRWGIQTPAHQQMVCHIRQIEQRECRS